VVSLILLVVAVVARSLDVVVDAFIDDDGDKTAVIPSETGPVGACPV